MRYEDDSIQVQLKEYEFSEETIDKLKDPFETNYPILYILYNTDKKKMPEAYIGQSRRFNKRMEEHLKSNKKSKMKKVIMLGHETLNVSAALNIETNLISCFIADEKYTVENRSQIKGSESHNYYEKKYYDECLFPKIWNRLKDEKIVTHSVEFLRNKDTFKLSPFRGLSPEQQDLKEKVIDFCKRGVTDADNNSHVFFIAGEAGTGKSVVLSSIFKTIQDLAENKASTNFNMNNNYLLVNHNEMLKTYKKIAESLPNLRKKDFMKPTSFINDVDKGKIEQADIVLVDESHLLLSTKDKYNNFEFENQLEEIIKRSKVTIVVFDEKQVLKLKSHWDVDKLMEIKNKFPIYEEYHLTTQFRMKAAPEIVHWVDSFVNRKILSFPRIKKREKLQTEKRFGDEDFDFRFFSSAEDMRLEIAAKNQKYGLSRIVSTFDYTHKKDGEDYLVEEGTFSAPWNRTDYKKSWAEEEATINEVGSIYTVQGFDLNYVGVILGPSIGYDPEKDEVTIDIDKYKDSEAFKNREGIDNIEKAKEQIIMNSINVLLKRGINGLYIYASNDKLREKLMTIQKENNNE
ncbi:DNA/RNA helicase domain-containing protein [Enterococcus sp. UD-01]|uniref:DNA/RNA helicase domain-containing protein n=1 Tax=Enterococcus sp. UD-01 TaxID=3373911 RepID=UPI0038334058